MVRIGDLVFYENRLGLVVEIFFEAKLQPAPMDAKIMWCDSGVEEWCLAEVLKIINELRDLETY